MNETSAFISRIILTLSADYVESKRNKIHGDDRFFVSIAHV